MPNSGETETMENELDLKIEKIKLFAGVSELIRQKTGKPKLEPPELAGIAFVIDRHVTAPSSPEAFFHEVFGITDGDDKAVAVKVNEIIYTNGMAEISTRIATAKDPKEKTSLDISKRSMTEGRKR